jgi:hypothetical protein
VVSGYKLVVDELASFCAPGLLGRSLALLPGFYCLNSVTIACPTHLLAALLVVLSH